MRTTLDDSQKKNDTQSQPDQSLPASLQYDSTHSVRITQSSLTTLRGFCLFRNACATDTEDPGDPPYRLLSKTPLPRSIT